MLGEEKELSVSIAHIVQKLKGSTLHCQLEKEARRCLLNPEIKLETLKEAIRDFLKSSGWEKKLQNAVYRELTVLPPPCHPAAPAEHSKEPLAYMRRAQASWEKRVLKSLNSMCTELNIPLARKRPAEEQKELLHKWNEMGTDEPDLTLFRPVYAPKDFLEVLINLRNPNYDSDQTSFRAQLGLIQVPLKIKDIPELREFFGELNLNTGQLGVDDSTPVPPELFENEQFRIGKKILEEHDSAAAQQYVRQGCPTALRAELWALILNISDHPEDILYYQQLKSNVIQHDLLSDSLIYKDVKLTASNDDYYFVFEDYLYQVLLCFSRDTSVLEHFAYNSATPPKSYIRGGLEKARSRGAQPQKAQAKAIKREIGHQQTSISKQDVVRKEEKGQKYGHRDSRWPVNEHRKAVGGKRESGIGSQGGRSFPPPTSPYTSPRKAKSGGKLGLEEFAVVYPPNGVIPFHGFSMYVAPLSFLYPEPARLYQVFREMYVRYFFRLHSISSHISGIMSLCLLFETLLQTHLPQLFYHLREIGAQPLRISFKWMVRAFSGYLATDQLLLLWDRILGYNSLEILAVLAAAVFAFRAMNLMEVTSLAAAEAVLADISTLKVMPLLQIFLFATVT